MNRKRIRLIIISSTVLFTGLILWKIGIPLVRYVNDPQRFRDWVEYHGIYGRLVYCAMVLFEVIVAIVPGEPFEILGGYCFGAMEGTILCVVASALGSMIVFLFVRKYRLAFVHLFFEESKIKKLSFLSKEKRTFLFLLLFMIPGTPKDLMCYVAGLTNIGIGQWLIICSLGRIPAIITSTISGDALGTQSYKLAILTFGITFLISALGLYIFNYVQIQQNSGE